MMNNRPIAPLAYVNTLNCLILQSNTAIRFVPPYITVYFINSKRRFFIYFKTREHMIECMRIFTEVGLRYYIRESILPDRQEHEEQIFHCNYKFKKIDLRRNLHHSTVYNQPRLHFDRYEKARLRLEQSKKQQQRMNEQIPTEIRNADDQQKRLNPQKQTPSSNIYRFKNQQVRSILQNKQLLQSVFFYLNTI